MIEDHEYCKNGCQCGFQRGVWPRRVCQDGECEIALAAESAKAKTPEPMDDGGPAFPVPETSLDSAGVFSASNQGMSLRDWFAGMALQGLLSNSGGPIQANGMSGWGWTNCDQKNVADIAWGMADTMLAARKEGA